MTPRRKSPVSLAGFRNARPAGERWVYARRGRPARPERTLEEVFRIMSGIRTLARSLRIGRMRS